jgi:hypothetical protein
MLGARDGTFDLHQVDVCVAGQRCLFLAVYLATIQESARFTYAEDNESVEIIFERSRGRINETWRTTQRAIARKISSSSALSPRRAP